MQAPTELTVTRASWVPGDPWGRGGSEVCPDLGAAAARTADTARSGQYLQYLQIIYNIYDYLYNYLLYLGGHPRRVRVAGGGELLC